MIIKYPDPTVLKFTVPGKPQGKERARNNSKGKKPYKPEKTRAYEEDVRWEYIRACKTSVFADGEAIFMQVVAYYPVPTRANKAEKAAMLACDQYPICKPDADNVLKIIADALNKLAYNDDAQITTASVTKLFSENPRVEVSLGIDFGRRVDNVNAY